MSKIQDLGFLPSKFQNKFTAKEKFVLKFGSVLQFLRQLFIIRSLGTTQIFPLYISGKKVHQILIPLRPPVNTGTAWLSKFRYTNRNQFEVEKVADVERSIA